MLGYSSTRHCSSDMSVQLQDEGDESAQVQDTEDDEGEEILGISRDDSRIILPRELIRNIPMTMPRRRGGRRGVRPYYFMTCHHI